MMSAYTKTTTTLKVTIVLAVLGAAADYVTGSRALNYMKGCDAPQSVTGGIVPPDKVGTLTVCPASKASTLAPGSGG